MSEQWDKAVKVWENTDGADDMKATNMAEVLFGCIEAVRAEVEQARLEAHARCRVLESELETAVLRIKALEESLEDLLHGEAGETDVTVRVEEPELNVRTNHKVTAKGWRLDETGVTWTGRGVPDWRAINTEMANAFEFGSVEAARRNSIPGVVADAS